jgi:hypothetical protein
VSAAALVCAGRWTVDRTVRRQVGATAEMTFWEGGLAQAFEAAARLAWPTCGPRCLGSAHLLLVWRTGNRPRVLDLNRLDLNPRKRRDFPVSRNRKTSRVFHQARALEKLIAEGQFDLAAALTNGDMTAEQAQKEYRQRKGTHG